MTLQYNNLLTFVSMNNNNNGNGNGNGGSTGTGSYHGGPTGTGSYNGGPTGSSCGMPLPNLYNYMGMVVTSNCPQYVNTYHPTTGSGTGYYPPTTTGTGSSTGYHPTGMGSSTGMPSTSTGMGSGTGMPSTSTGTGSGTGYYPPTTTGMYTYTCAVSPYVVLQGRSYYLVTANMASSGFVSTATKSCGMVRVLCSG